MFAAAGCNGASNPGTTASNAGTEHSSSPATRSDPPEVDTTPAPDADPTETSAPSYEAASVDDGSSASSADVAPDAVEPAPEIEPSSVDPPALEPAAPATAAPPGNPAVAVSLPKPAPPPAEVYRPEILLSDHHAATCVVNAGDPFPALALPDLEGNTRELRQLFGDRMTIVVFWTARNLYVREQFTRIVQETFNRYAALGVKVVAIDVGDAPDAVQELATQNKVTVPCLLDADGQAFGQVGRELLPRTYLLDAEGRILWFDLEYSRGHAPGLAQRGPLFPQARPHLMRGPFIAALHRNAPI